MLVKKPPVVHDEWRHATTYDQCQDKTTELIFKCQNSEDYGDQNIKSNVLVTSHLQNPENKTQNEKLKNKATFKSLFKNIHFMRLMIMELLSTIGCVWNLVHVTSSGSRTRFR